MAIGAIVAAAHVSPHGQEPSPPQQPPTFRVGTNLVRVDVTVIDRRGNPVTSLTQDDFDVREDGQPQPITSFKLVLANGQPTDEQSLPIRNPQHAAAEAAKDDVRVFLVFWDEYHIAPFDSALRARDALTRAVLGAFGPTDLVALMDPLTTLDAIRFTRDRRELANQVHMLKGRRGVYYPPRSVIEEAHIEKMRQIERIRCQVTKSAVQAAAAHLGTLREGPNALVLVTEGFGACGQDAIQELRDLVRTASASHTAIYVVDPRGLQMRSMPLSFLESVASGTGGEVSRSNDMALAFNRVVQQASAFYLLGYAKDVPSDGRFHEIKVRVKRPGLEVRARAGYWAERAADVERARAAAAAAEPPTAVADALARLLPLDAPRAVDLWVGTAPLDDGRTRVTLAWTARPVPPETRHAPVRVAVTATAGGGPAFQGAIAGEGTSFDVRPGPLQLAIDVRDADEEAIDHDTRVLSVPDARGEALAVSTPVVIRLRTAQERRAGPSQPQPPVYAGRDFERTDRLLVRVVTSGASRAEEHVSAKLLDRTGAPRTDLRIEAGPARTGYQVDFPLSSIARGEFVVSIQISRGDEHVEALVAFRVVR